LKTLIAARRATISLHGCTHQDLPDGFEFQAARDPERRVRDGLRHLRDTLGAAISVFVPPHNALSRRGLAAVGEAGLNILGSFLSFLPSMSPRYALHAVACGHSWIPGTSRQELSAGFDEARRVGGDCCLATHYWEVDDPMKQVLLRFLDHASRFTDVRFVAAEELFA